MSGLGRGSRKRRVATAPAPYFTYQRVQRLMVERGLVSVHPWPRKRTTVPAATPSELPDLAGSSFYAGHAGFPVVRRHYLGAYLGGLGV